MRNAMLGNDLNLTNVYLTITPRARVGYEMVDNQRGALAIIISHPTSSGGMIALLKTPLIYIKVIPQYCIAHPYCA